MQHKKLVLSCVVTALVFGAGGFFGGMQFAKMGRPNQMRFTGAPNMQRGSGNPQLRGGAAFGGGASGEVITKDDKSLTLKLMDGGSKIVYLSPSTTVNKTSAGSMEDVSSGTKVMVVGSQNQDGSVTASMIQLR